MKNYVKMIVNILLVLTCILLVGCTVDTDTIESNLIKEMQDAVDDNLEKFGNNESMLDYQNSIYKDLEHLEKDEIDVQIKEKEEKKGCYEIKVIFNRYFPARYYKKVYTIEIPESVNIKEFDLDELIRNKNIIVSNEVVEIDGKYNHQYVTDRMLQDSEEEKNYASKNTLKRYFLWDLGFINVEIEEENE